MPCSDTRAPVSLSFCWGSSTQTIRVAELILGSPSAASLLISVAAVIPPEQAPEIFTVLDLVIWQMTSMASTSDCT